MYQTHIDVIQTRQSDLIRQANRKRTVTALKHSKRLSLEQRQQLSQIILSYD